MTSVGPIKSNVLTIQRSTSAKSSFEGKGSPEINLISLTYSNKVEKIDEFLRRNPSLPLLTMKDIRLYTLLHIACLNSQLNICKKFLTYLKTQNVSDEEFKEWINARTDEGFTAVHFASFKGNLELIKLLESNGADIFVKNYQGLNVMHIAAQGDQPISLAYFLHKGFNMLEKDNKGSTALHWAAFLGMENATIYLTSWGSDPNLKDVESGFTPLHLAVISGNGRVVRRLLIKHADRLVKDNEGKTAKDLAIENEYVHIVQLLEGRGWLVECLNIKPGFQRKRSRLSLVFFLSLFTTVAMFNFLFLFPYFNKFIWVVMYGVLVGLTLAFFLLSWLVNPGYMKSKKADVLGLLQRYEPHRICPECVIVKPERSRHCDFCGSCVAVFDHHCPWIDNCVGARNHKYFLLFTLFTLLSIIYLMVAAIYFIGVHNPTFEYFSIFFEDETALFDLKEATCSGNIVLFLTFAIPLLMLNYIQIGNFITGKTTNERYGFQGVKDMHKQKTEEISTVEADYMKMDDQEGRTRHDSGSFFTNCRAMCCTNARDIKYGNSNHRMGIN